MARFAANLSMLFIEVDFVQRFAAAAEAGFSGVEYLFPYAYPAEQLKAQLDANPGRHEPGTGEINYPFLFEHLDRLGYQGWIGCEYKPATTTRAGFGWLQALINVQGKGRAPR